MFHVLNSCTSWNSYCVVGKSSMWMFRNGGRAPRINLGRAASRTLNKRLAVSQSIWALWTFRNIPTHANTLKNHDRLRRHRGKTQGLELQFDWRNRPLDTRLHENRCLLDKQMVFRTQQFASVVTSTPHYFEILNPFWTQFIRIEVHTVQ
jgi:hypothetical protein